MFPRLFTYESFALPTYGVLVALGFVAGLAVAVRLAGRERLDKDQMFNFGVYLALAGMLGAKVFLVIQDWDYYRENPRQIFSTSTLQSGGIFYGGLLVAIAFAFLFIRRARLPFWKVADCFVPGIALGHTFGRLGCFAAGCCWGEPSGLPWAVAFHDPYAHQVVGVPLEVRMHPTQLYEATALLVIFAFLYRLHERRRFDGQVLGWYLLLYPAARFLIEFLRDHSANSWLWGNRLSDAQGVSLVLMAVGTWLLSTATRNQKSEVGSQKLEPLRRVQR
ncbi:MAG: prolipoprotein diacylglyceryl transferase [Acidobacteria bacterium RIFCSPLOWO2_12_FULL_60_22]|nr:MAG: prolipoprotein diacylglyceryl transferase [Acidobacteria bacterium RIFCSPLOWO2_12_FULL_60_22]